MTYQPLTDDELGKLCFASGTSHEYGRAVEVAVLARLPAPAVEWVDKWGATNTVSIARAAQTLKEFGDEWPGGLNEIESALKTASVGLPAPEPVAWRVNYCQGTDIPASWHYSETRPNLPNVSIQPLYAAPARESGT